uniref:Uncharacterized protein n=1 Tax=Plectus sambesii TaxID=2011161 RepID=A0A914XJN2_9BILA
MTKNKRSRPNSSDEVYKTEVQQPSLVFDENIDYERVFEENMYTLESDFNLPWDTVIQEAWNSAWSSLLNLKAKWLFYQKIASLAIPIPAPHNANGQMWNGDAYKLREKFQRMYAYLERYPEWDSARAQLIKQSMIVEWPRTYVPFNEDGEVKSLTVDRAPILHMSMKTVTARVRRWHPTVQLSILALNKQTAIGLHTQFTARLVTQNSTQVQLNEPWCSVGRLICTERDGEIAMPKGIICNGNALVIAGGINEHGALWFDNTGTLCAKFSDLGIDTGEKRKKKNLQRYCVDIVSEIRLANGFPLKHSTLSHPFVTLPNATEKMGVLGDIVREILSAEPGNTDTPVKERKVTWHKLKLMMQHYVQSQLNEARTLDKEELFHLQTMLFLPLALSSNDLLEFELLLFGSNDDDVDKQGIKKIKYRLLREPVRDDFPVHLDSFFTHKCIQLKDCKTKLDHSVWEWLFEAVEVLVDRNNSALLCEDVSQQKTKKDKKSSMMIKLFNDRIITMSSRERVWRVYKMLAKYDATHQPHQQTLAMLIRFCESEAASLSFAYSNIEGSELKPSFGSMKAEKIKQMNNGLIGMVKKAPWPSKFNRLVRFKYYKGEGKSGAHFITKQQIFPDEKPKKKTSSEAVSVDSDSDIDPLCGPTEFRRLKPSPNLDFASYVRQAVEMNALRDRFEIMSVSTADSGNRKLLTKKKNSNTSQQNYFSCHY